MYGEDGSDEDDDGMNPIYDLRITIYDLKSSNDIKHYSAEDISRYWQGKLTSEEMHAMERAAMDDPFLADAMEGYSTANPQQVTRDLAELRERLQEKSSKPKVVPLQRRWWRVAAVIILLGGASALTYRLLERNNSSDNLVQVQKTQARPEASQQPINTTTPAIIQNKTVIADSLPVMRYTVEPSKNTQGFAGAPSKANGNFESADQTKDLAAGSFPNAAYKKRLDTPDFAATAKAAMQSDSLLAARTAAANNARSENAEMSRNNAPANQTNQVVVNETNRNLYLNNFSGRVIDADNNAIPRASLRVNNNSQLAVTDNNGYFNIRSGDSLLDLSVASSGYVPRQLTLRSNQPSDVVLDPVPVKKSASKESYAGKAPSPRSKTEDKSLKVYPMEAEPDGGWDAYKIYLDKNNRLAGKDSAAEVVVSFNVAKNGKLSSFEIEKSAGKQQDAEAIRLVKDGPDWKVLKGRKTRARVIVSF